MGETMRLSFPERRSRAGTRFDTRRSAVRSWVRQLPVANPVETGRHLYEALSYANRRPCRPRNRLAFMGELHEILNYTVDGLRSYYRERELPLRGTPRKTATLATRLLQEMALGYEIALEDLRDRRSRQAKRALAIGTAMHYRGLVFVEGWLIYENAPPGSWQRLHELYQIGLDAGLNQYPLRAERLGRGSRTSSATIYKHIALAAASSPLQLDRGEILDVWWLLGHWADAAEISPLGDDGDEVFRVPRHDDRPPHPGIGGLNRSDDRFLITTPLIKRVQHELRQSQRWLSLRRKRGIATAYPEMTQRLLIALAAVPARQHRRVRVRYRVDGVLGITEGHRVLSREQGLPVVSSETRERAFQARDNRETQRERDVWDMIHPEGLADVIERQIGRRPEQDEVSKGGQGEDARRLDHWQMVNISPRGYCLLTNPEKTYRARVGELMVLRESVGRARHWQLGVVRWLRGLGGKNLQIGVQILGVEPRPVMLRGRLQNGRYAPPERGFVLPASKRNGSVTTVVTPGPHYHCDQHVALRYGQLQGELVLRHQREVSNHFAQCEFEYGDPVSVDNALPETLSASADAQASSGAASAR